MDILKVNFRLGRVMYNIIFILNQNLAFRRVGGRSWVRTPRIFEYLFPIY